MTFRSLSGHVNDTAGMLHASTKQQLEAVLTDLEKTDSTQVAVLTIDSLEGDSLEDFSMRVAEQWKIGQKGSDNGAILLVARQDRKIRIEVGYGLEGKLTDLMAGTHYSQRYRSAIQVRPIRSGHQRRRSGHDRRGAR